MINVEIPKIKLKSISKTFRDSGKEFEEKVKRDLKRKGYNISKPYNKHYDIHAVKNNKTYIVECKCNKAGFSQDELHQALTCKEKGQVYLLARQNDNGGIVYFKPGNKNYLADRKERLKKYRNANKPKSSVAGNLNLKMPKFSIKVFR